MKPYCVSCKHHWVNSDGLVMCGRPVDPPTGPLYCHAERHGPPQAGRELCGPRAQYFEAKP